jgi:hypothetical protein
MLLLSLLVAKKWKKVQGWIEGEYSWGTVFLLAKKERSKCHFFFLSAVAVSDSRNGYPALLYG